MTVFLSVAGILDHLYHRIPNLLTAMLFAFCLVRAVAGEGYPALFPIVLRMVIVGAMLFPVFAIGALGGGDVKLLAVCAGFYEGDRCIYFLFGTFVIAAVFGAVKMLKAGQMKKRMLRLYIYIRSFIHTGKAERYHACREAAMESGVALAGAMFLSSLMGIGGLY